MSKVFRILESDYDSGEVGRSYVVLVNCTISGRNLRDYSVQ